MSRVPGRGADVVRGLGALLVLLTLLAGLPIGLAVYSAALLPDHPSVSLSGIGHALLSPDSGQLFMRALAVVGWIGWAAFAVAVVLEIPAQLRRRPTLRVPGLGWSQKAAATLVTSVTVMLAAPLAPMAMAAPAHAAVVATASAQPAASASTSTPAQAAATGTYTVAPGDSLWKISEKLLGRGGDYSRIADLNAGRVMSDGTVFHSDGFLQPGWQLRVPAEAKTATAAEPRTEPATSTVARKVTVHPGDSLWKIAGQEYGQPTDYPQLWAANHGRAEPGGQHFTDEDLIRPGWTLDVPAPDAAAAQAPAAAQNSPATTTPPATAPVTMPTPLTTPTSSPPTSHAPAATGTAPTAAAGPAIPTHAAATQQSAPAPTASATAAPADTAPAEQGDHGAVATVLGISGLTAAGLLSLVAFKRSRQQRSRRPGRRIRTADPGAPTGLRLKMTATVAPADLADRALRTLAVLCAEAGRPVPPLDRAVLDAAGLHLHLPTPDQAIAPFAGDDTVWTCPGNAGVLDEQACAEIAAPYPALVAIGDIPGGGQLLIDLESAGLLAVAGQQDDVEHVLRAVLVELATSARADELNLVAIGLDELAGALGGPRLRTAANAMAALHDLGDHAESTTVALADLQLPDLRTARTAAVEPANWTPQIVICARPLDEDETALLLRILQRFPAAPIAVIAPAGQLPAAWPDATVLPAEPVLVDWPGVDGVRVQRIDDEDYGQILTYLRAANDRDDVPAEPWPAPEGAEDEFAADDVVPEQVWHGWEQTAAAADPEVATLWPQTTVDAHGQDLLSPSSVAVPVFGPWPTPPTPDALPDEDVADAHQPLLFESAEADDTDGMTVVDETAVDINAGIQWLRDLQAEEPEVETPPAADTEEQSDAADEDRRPDAAAAHASQAAAWPGTAVTPLRGHPHIRLLGSVDILGIDGPIEDSRRERMTELAAFIILNPGASHDRVAEALWPGGVEATTRNSQVSRLRAWFGSHPDGSKYLPEARRNYRFHESVTCDWLEFSKMARLAAARGPDRIDDLQAALRLVRGKPLAGIDPTRYAWIDSLQLEMSDEIADAAIAVTEARLAAGNPRTALEAAVLGLSAAPENERLHRARLMAAWRLGDDAEIDRTAAQLEKHLTNVDMDMEPETKSLYQEILKRRRSHQAAG